MVPGMVESFSCWVQLTWAVKGCLPGERATVAATLLDVEWAADE